MELTGRGSLVKFKGKLKRVLIENDLLPTFRVIEPLSSLAISEVNAVLMTDGEVE